MRFDRSVPHGGVKIGTRVENGKAYLEFEFFYEAFHLQEEQNGEAVAESEALAEHYVYVHVYDRDGKEVFRCIYPVAEEEPLPGILLHPHLWNGMEEPYFYRVKADLVAGDGGLLDGLEKDFMLRTLTEVPQKGWFLNGKALEVRAVRLEWQEMLSQEAAEDRMQKLLQLLKGMGANALCLSNENEGCKDTFQKMQLLCEKQGFIVWKNASSIPDADSLFQPQTLQPTNRYYDYKARWSREPFVHICADSIKKQENGTYSLTIYSNQKKLALYVNGILFEFRTGGQEYKFEEIPAKQYPLQLAVEAGECNISLTIYACSQKVHNYVTFS